MNWFYEHPYLAFILGIFLISVINNISINFLEIFKKQNSQTFNLKVDKEQQSEENFGDNYH